MGICKIQKPTGFNEKHGKLYAQIFCDNAEGEEFSFDATKGDLRLNLVCEEEVENDVIYIGKGDNDEMLDAIWQKLLAIQTEQVQINEKMNQLNAKIDLTNSDNFIQNNPINIGE